MRRTLSRVRAHAQALWAAHAPGGAASAALGELERLRAAALSTPPPPPRDERGPARAAAEAEAARLRERLAAAEAAASAAATEAAALRDERAHTGRHGMARCVCGKTLSRVSWWLPSLHA